MLVATAQGDSRNPKGRLLTSINLKRNNTVFNFEEFVVKFWLTLLIEIPTDDFKDYLCLENLKCL
jgi:hypothetical protein